MTKYEPFTTGQITFVPATEASARVV